MNARMNVLDIEIDNCSAKEAMKETVEHMESDPVSVIEMVTVDGLMQLDEVPGLKEAMRSFDLVLAGDKTILEAADVVEKKQAQEIENRLFLKLFFRFLHKNHRRVYLLVESEEEGSSFYEYLGQKYGGMQVVGMAKVSAENRADDMLVNAINGGEIDCILSALSSPLQEDFIVKNKNLLNVRVWLGVGQNLMLMKTQGRQQGKFRKFLMRKIFQRELEKRKKTPEQEVALEK